MLLVDELDKVDHNIEALLLEILSAWLAKWLKLQFVPIQGILIASCMLQNLPWLKPPG